MTWTKLNVNDYAPEADAHGTIILPSCAPFDGNPVLVRTSIGIVEAWWQAWTSTPTLEDPYDGDGGYWVGYDDAFQFELDDVLEWMPIPGGVTNVNS